MRLLLLTCCAAALSAQPLPDYSTAAKPFPFVLRPYLPRLVPEPDLTSNSGLPSVENGKLRLTMDQLIAAVVANNLTIAGARYYPFIAQTDLLRSRSGASPRGVDATRIPSGVFSGAVGGSILGTAGGGGGGSSNAGGITGSAGRVSIRPAGLFDPTLSASFSMDRTNSPLNTLVVAGIPSVSNHTAALSLGYVQAFPTGTSFTASYGFQRQASNQLHLLYNPDFTPGFTFTVSQQLANGFGFAVNRALIKVSENEQKIEKESFRQQAMAAIASAQNAYWDVAAAQGAVRSAREALDAANTLVSNNQRQVEIGTMAVLDVATAQSQAAAARRDLIAAQTNLQNLELQLKGMLVRTLTEPLASASIEIADAFPDAESAKIPALEAALEEARQHRPDVAVAEGNIQSQKDALPFIRNALLPNVNAFALLTTVGLYNFIGSAFVEAIHFKYPEVAFGVTVTFPIRNRQAQADEVRSQLELRQSEDTLVRTKSQVEVDVQNALIALRQSQAQVRAARQALRLEQQKLDAEQQKLNAGLSNPYNVILVQRDLLTAELAEVQSLDTFAKAGVSLDVAMGLTLDHNQISLDDLMRGALNHR